MYVKFKAIKNFFKNVITSNYTIYKYLSDSKKQIINVDIMV